MNAPPRLSGVGRDHLLAMIARLVAENTAMHKALAAEWIRAVHPDQYECRGCGAVSDIAKGRDAFTHAGGCALAPKETTK